MITTRSGVVGVIVRLSDVGDDIDGLVGVRYDGGEYDAGFFSFDTNVYLIFVFLFRSAAIASAVCRKLPPNLCFTAEKCFCLIWFLFFIFNGFSLCILVLGFLRGS